MQIAEDHAVDHDKGRIVTGSYRANSGNALWMPQGLRRRDCLRL